MPELNTDYLIIGAGALGVGFLDEIIRNSEDLQAVIVDVRDKPGGHWSEQRHTLLDSFIFIKISGMTPTPLCGFTSLL